MEKAEEDLKDTEYDHYIDAQKDLLDDLYSQYEETLNARLDNIDLLMKDMITKINENASTIASTLTAEATNVGTTLTTEMSSIWSEAGTKISEYKDAFVTNSTTVNNTLSNIKLEVEKMVSALNTEASGGDGNSGSGNNGGNSKGGSGSNTKNSDKRKLITKTTKLKNGRTMVTVLGEAPAFFINKTYTGDKKKLKGTNDLRNWLRYHDFDASDAALEKYYKAMGLKGKFTKGGTYDQRTAMKNWIRKKGLWGYKRGSHSILEDQLAWTNENTPETIIRKSDGAILTPLKAGDMVLNTAAHENIWDMAADPTKFISDHFMGTVPAATTVNNSNEMNYNGDCNVSINLPNVESYNDFVRKMQHDNNLEKMMQSMTVSRTSGAGPMKKYRY